MKNSKNLSFNFAILTSLPRNIVTRKILILNIIILNKVHWWKLHSSWNMLEGTHKSWKLKTQFWWNSSIILKYIDQMKNSIDILYFYVKIIYIQKHPRRFQETWYFTHFHSSLTAYTIRLVGHCHNIISSLISASKKHTMKFSTNTWKNAARVSGTFRVALY